MICDQQRGRLGLLPLPVLNGERGGVRGGVQHERLCPSPQPSQPKSDISDFGQLLEGPNSGIPEFGCPKRGEREPRGVRCNICASISLGHASRQSPLVSLSGIR
jgi:hypothetical protein